VIIPSLVDVVVGGGSICETLTSLPRVKVPIVDSVIEPGCIKAAAEDANAGSNKTDFEWTLIFVICIFRADEQLRACIRCYYLFFLLP